MGGRRGIVSRMTETDLIGSTEALGILGIDRSTLSRWVAAGRLVPVTRLGASGAFVFARAAVVAAAADRAADTGPIEATA